MSSRGGRGGGGFKRQRDEGVSFRGGRGGGGSRNDRTANTNRNNNNDNYNNDGNNSSGRGGSGASSNPSSRQRRMNEQILIGKSDNASDEDDDDEEEENTGSSRRGGNRHNDDDTDDDEQQEETADAKRLRLAKEMLSKMARAMSGARSSSSSGGSRATVDHLDTTAIVDDDTGGHEEDEQDEQQLGGGSGSLIAPLSGSAALHAAIASKLRDENLAAAGTLFRPLAKRLGTVIAAAASSSSSSSSSSSTSPQEQQQKFQLHFKKAHSLSVTNLALTPDGKTAFTSSKDCSIIRWSIQPTEGTLSYVVKLPGRVRTKADVARQVASVSKDGYLSKKGILPVYGAAFGGGRLGHSASSGGGGGDEEDGGGNGSSSSNNTTKILHAPGISSITTFSSSSKISSKQRAIAIARGMPDYNIIGHWDEVLSLAVSTDGQFLASGGRDKTVRLWDVTSTVAQTRKATVEGTTTTSTTTTQNKKASSSSSSQNQQQQQQQHQHQEHLARFAPGPIETFVGHKDAVSAVCFRAGTHALYSAGYDRMVKLWSADEMAHLDTLFGHQDAIYDMAVCTGVRERAMTVGADKTSRLWKVAEQSQLVFRGHAQDLSLECIRPIGEGLHFVTGSQDGSLCLWSTQKKRPLFTIHQAHGTGMHPPSQEQYLTPAMVAARKAKSEAEAAAALVAATPAAANGTLNKVSLETGRNGNMTLAIDADGYGPASHLREQIAAITGCDDQDLSSGYCNWITSLAVLSNSDLVATGSGDGFIRFWRIVPQQQQQQQQSMSTSMNALKSLEHVGAIPCKGVITSLSFSANGSVLVAAVGQEHRLGRWWKYRHGKNGILVFPLARVLGINTNTTATSSGKGNQKKKITTSASGEDDDEDDDDEEDDEEEEEEEEEEYEEEDEEEEDEAAPKGKSFPSSSKKSSSGSSGSLVGAGAGGGDARPAPRASSGGPPRGGRGGVRGGRGRGGGGSRGGGGRGRGGRGGGRGRGR